VRKWLDGVTVRLEGVETSLDAIAEAIVAGDD